MARGRRGSCGVDVLGAIGRGELIEHEVEVAAEADVGRDPADHRLPGVPLRVDEAGDHDQPEASIDLGVAGVDGGSHRGNSIVLEQDIATVEITDLRVHAQHMPPRITTRFDTSFTLSDVQLTFNLTASLTTFHRKPATEWKPGIRHGSEITNRQELTLLYAALSWSRGSWSGRHRRGTSGIGREARRDLCGARPCVVITVATRGAARGRESDRVARGGHRALRPRRAGLDRRPPCRRSARSTGSSSARWSATTTACARTTSRRPKARHAEARRLHRGRPRAAPAPHAGRRSILLRRARHGRPYPGSTTVSTVNGGVTGLVHTLAVELAPHPRERAAPGHRRRQPVLGEAAGRARGRAGATPPGRLVTMDDIVDAAIFLLDNGGQRRQPRRRRRVAPDVSWHRREPAARCTYSSAARRSS